MFEQARGWLFGLLIVLAIVSPMVLSSYNITDRGKSQMEEHDSFASNNGSDNRTTAKSSSGNSKGRQMLPSSVDLSSQYLPDALPAGDPVNFALPIFLSQPEDTYIVKSRPASLECRAAHALTLHFQCNDEVQRQAVTEDHVDPETGVRVTRATVEITRNQVEEFFGDYYCACVAVSGQGHTKSRLALVTVAFLKKTFEVPPYSDEGIEGNQVEMRCHPPKGKPDPDIYWLRNGVRIRDDDPNFIVTGDGHMIVVTARQEDSGNFTCVAENLAGRRESKPAELTIQAMGGWSAWSSWSNCSVSCGRGFRQRGRVCNSHSSPLSPQGGSGLCPGKAVEKKACDSPCPVQPGEWSQWSLWTICTEECKQSRHRVCDSPPGSTHRCFGLDYETVECVGGDCDMLAVWHDEDDVDDADSDKSLDALDRRRHYPDDKLALNEHLSDAGTATATTTTNNTNEIALYVGLSLAVVVFLLVVLVAISLLRRRRMMPHGYALSPSGYDVDQRKKVVGYSPDIVNHNSTEIASVCYEYSYPDSNSNHSKAGYRAASEHHYEQPMVILPTNRSPVDSIVKPLISDSSSSSTGGNISPRSAGTFDRSPGTTSTPLSHQPPALPTSQPPAHSSQPPHYQYQQLASYGQQHHHPAGYNMAGQSQSPTGCANSNNRYNANTSMGHHHHPHHNNSSHHSHHLNNVPPHLAHHYPSSGVGNKQNNNNNGGLSDSFIRWAAVTPAGARISLPESGGSISLTVPEGAVPHGTTLDLYLAVVHDTKAYPNLAMLNTNGVLGHNTTGNNQTGINNSTLLSPVIVVGPVSAASTLRKPVIISFPHVASLRHANWTISVVNCEDDNPAMAAPTCEEGPAWSKLVTLGQETINTNVYTQLDLNTCHLVTDGTLGGFALVGSVSASLGPAYKSLRVAAFAQSHHHDSVDLTVRVYCLPDTEDSLRYVTETEKLFGGRLLDRPVTTLLRSGGANLVLQLEKLVGGDWSVQPGASRQEVPYTHLWGGTNPNLHCSFTLLRHKSGSKNSNRAAMDSTSGNAAANQQQLIMHVSIQQEGNQSNKCSLRINTNLASHREVRSNNRSAIANNGNNGVNPAADPQQLPVNNTFSCVNTVGSTSSSTSSTSSGGSSSSAAGGSHFFRLPAVTKESLGRLLDRPVAGGNDWRLLAERLNVHRYTAFFASRASPTEAILNLWEARNRESSATQGLVGILRGMGRMDCVKVLEHDLNLA